MAEPALASAPRRPQQSRSLLTRRRLLRAALRTLSELGVARTSTTAVCRRAGVSQGALFKHFGSKDALLAAAVEHLFVELVDGYRRRFAAIAGRPDPVGEALRLLWESFSSPELALAFELYSAARTDAGLRDALEPVLRAHRSQLHAEARALFPGAATRNPHFEDVVDLVMSAMQGAALCRLVLPDDDAGAELARLEAFARRELGTAAG